MSPRRKLLLGLVFFGVWGGTLALAGSFGYRRGLESSQSGEPQDNPGPVRKDSRGKEFVELDLNRDGFWETQQYEDSAGLMTEHRIDQNKDKKIDLIREFDEDGKLTHEREDVNFDGAFDRWVEFSRDGVLSREFYDLDFDGTRDQENEMDEEGQVRKSVTKHHGMLLDESWYKLGLLQKSHVDLNRDGVPDTELLFDSMGVLEQINKLKH